MTLLVEQGRPVSPRCPTPCPRVPIPLPPSLDQTLVYSVILTQPVQLALFRKLQALVVYRCRFFGQGGSLSITPHAAGRLAPAGVSSLAKDGGRGMRGMR